MSDPSRDLVDAILAVTPVHPVRGDVITGWTYEPDPPAVAAKLVHPWRPERGDPRPVAERQAVAVLRLLADQRHTWGDHANWDVTELRELADQLDADASPDPTDRACPDRPRCIPVGCCIRPHCDKCGGHYPIRDSPGDFAVCKACRDEMDAERETRDEETRDAD